VALILTHHDPFDALDAAYWNYDGAWPNFVDGYAEYIPPNLDVRRFFTETIPYDDFTIIVSGYRYIEGNTCASHTRGWLGLSHTGSPSENTSCSGWGYNLSHILHYGWCNATTYDSYSHYTINIHSILNWTNGIAQSGFFTFKFVKTDNQLITYYKINHEDAWTEYRTFTIENPENDLFFEIVEGDRSSIGNGLSRYYDYALFVPDVVTHSGNISLNIAGYKAQLSSACPVLDSTAAIQISSGLISIYQSRIDALINQLGVNVELEFDPEVTPCPNCKYDGIRKRSTGIYNGTGPEPFVRGRICPVCRGRGVLEIESETRCIKCLVQWNPKDIRNYGITVSDPWAIVRTKCLMSDIEYVKRCKTAKINTEIEDTLLLRVRRLRDPFPVGLREDRYCITFWELIEE
jgi:hypothetical protein